LHDPWTTDTKDVRISVIYDQLSWLMEQSWLSLSENSVFTFLESTADPRDHFEVTLFSERDKLKTPTSTSWKIIPYNNLDDRRLLVANRIYQPGARTFACFELHSKRIANERGDGSELSHDGLTNRNAR
jgi:hypothetical protein